MQSLGFGSRQVRLQRVGSIPERGAMRKDSVTGEAFVG
jgi:hypothetical protein